MKALEKVVDGLSQCAGLALVAEWEKMDVVPKKVNGVWVSVFEASLSRALRVSSMFLIQCQCQLLTIIQVLQLKRKLARSSFKTKKSLNLLAWIPQGVFN